MTDANYPEMSGDVRRRLGGIFTLVRDDGLVSVIHIPGASMKEACEDVALAIDRYAAAGQRWLIRSISTPATVLQDVIGRPRAQLSQVFATPEQIFLGRIGRQDLLEQRVSITNPPSGESRRLG